MKLLVDISAGQLLSSGLFPDLEGEAAPLWRDGENIIFEHGGVRKAYGLLGLDDFSARPTGAKSTKVLGESRLYVGAGLNAYKWTQGGGFVSIGNFTAVGGLYQFVPWKEWTLISNAVDPVALWQNAGLAAPITAPFTKANVIFKYGNQLFAGGTSNGVALVEWSSVNDPTDWTPTLTNTAGDLLCGDLEGEIVAARPIGGSVGIYSNANAGTFTYVGGDNPFSFRRPISGVSALSPYSVVTTGDKHYGLTSENAFLTDLISTVRLDEPAVRRYVAANADWDRQQEVYGWQDWTNGLIRWSVPKIGGDTFGIGYRPDGGQWTKFNDSVVLGEESGPFSSMILCKSMKLLRQDKASTDNDTVALGSFVRTKPLDLGEPNRYKRISKVSLNMSWSGSVSVRLGYSNHPNDTPNWVITTPAANEIFPDQFGQMSEMVYLSLEILTTDPGADWNLTGGKVYGEVCGYVN